MESRDVPLNVLEQPRADYAKAERRIAELIEPMPTEKISKPVSKSEALRLMRERNT